MTSNLASHYILEHTGEVEEVLRDHVERALREAFRPEFLNRVDDTIVFRALSREDLLSIVNLQLDRLRRSLAQRRIDLIVTDSAKRRLAEAGYDPAFGARPLKRTIQRMIQDPLALGLLDGRFVPGDTIEIEGDGGTVTLRKGSPVPQADEDPSDRPGVRR
jgi:ATP-dependent Clp protease ATP-binding subunit ClpA